jgi:hypothetical protein
MDKADQVMAFEAKNFVEGSVGPDHGVGHPMAF